MKTLRSAKLTRRDRCYLIGRRARLLKPAEAAAAWYALATHLDTNCAERDLPKFGYLLAGIRAATTIARRKTAEST